MSPLISNRNNCEFANWTFGPRKAPMETGPRIPSLSKSPSYIRQGEAMAWHAPLHPPLLRSPDGARRSAGEANLTGANAARISDRAVTGWIDTRDQKRRRLSIRFTPSARGERSVSRSFQN